MRQTTTRHIQVLKGGKYSFNMGFLFFLGSKDPKLNRYNKTIRSTQMYCSRHHEKQFT